MSLFRFMRACGQNLIFSQICGIDYSFHSFPTFIITKIGEKIKFSSQSPLTHVHTWSATGRYIPWV